MQMDIDPILTDPIIKNRITPSLYINKLNPLIFDNLICKWKLFR